MTDANDTTMVGLWIEDGAVRQRHDLPRPEPGTEEALVEVSVAGICGTDLQLLRGYAGWRGVPGHEFVGRVVEGPAPWLGARVAADINVACGACPRCRAGERGHCARREVIGIRGRWGAFAELIAVPLANLHRVPAGIDDRRAVFAEPLAAALRITELVPPGPGERWLVIGDGRLGQLVARVVALGPARVDVAGRHERKLALLAAVGARPLAPGVEPGGDYDVVVECTGSAAGLVAAQRAVRPLGTVVLKSTHVGASPLDATRVVVDEVKLVGSRCGPIDAALRWLAEERIDVEPLIDCTFPLGAGVEAFEYAARRSTLKVLLTPAG